VSRDDSNICSRNNIIKSRISDDRMRSAESPETAVGTQRWLTHAKYGWLQSPTTDMRPRQPNGAKLICFSEGFRHIWAKADADEGQRGHAHHYCNSRYGPVFSDLYQRSIVYVWVAPQRPSMECENGYASNRSWAAGRCGRTLVCALTAQLVT
jgi:hypothetical protein